MLEVAQELGTSLEKLLMIARLDPSRVRRGFSQLDMGMILSDAVHIYRSALQEKQITLTEQISLNVHALGDPTLIREAIRNVLDNALRFTPENGAVTVELKREGDHALL